MSQGFTGPRPPADFNMARYCIENAAVRDPDKIGLIVLGGSPSEPITEQWRYADIEDAVLRLAGCLTANNIAAGERLIVALGNSSDTAFLFFGALAAGVVPLPVPDTLSPRELTFVRDNAAISLIATQLDRLPASDENWSQIKRLSAEDVAQHRKSWPRASYADTQADDPAFLIYTSGTTGKPKGVLHAHRSAWGRRPMYRDWYGIGADDRVLHAGAFNWTYTLGTGLTDPWANGATAIINTQPRDPSLWPGLIRHTEASIFAAVPSLYRQILKYAPPGPIDVGTLRHGLTAGETLPASVAEEWFSRTGTRLHEALGMSEMSTYISTSPECTAKPGTVGCPQTGRCVAILPTESGTTPLPPGEIGLLAVHRTDPGLMIDYWERPDESEKVFRGDWFYGGDLASMDEDGYVTHHGRADDVMNAFGYRVSPQEVEQVLAGTPGAGEIAVTDVKVRDGVNIIAAFVVPSDREPGDLLPALKSRADTMLAEYKRPRDYIVADALPRTPNGKIRRADLQSIFDNRSS